MYEVLIREAGNDEIEIVRLVMYEAFKEYAGILQPPSGALHETVEGIKKKIEGKGGAIIAWEQSEPVGAALYYFELDYMYIGRISVVPSYRGKGIGKAIITYLEDQAMKKGYSKTRIEVRQSLPDNLRLYTMLKP